MLTGAIALPIKSNSIPLNVRISAMLLRGCVRISDLLMQKFFALSFYEILEILARVSTATLFQDST